MSLSQKSENHKQITEWNTNDSLGFYYLPIYYIVLLEAAEYNEMCHATFLKKDRKIQIVDQTLISENAMFRKHCKYK